MTSKVDAVEEVGADEEQEVNRYSRLWTAYLDSLIRDNTDLVRTVLSAQVEKLYYKHTDEKDEYGDSGIIFRAEVSEEATELIQAEFERIHEARIESMEVH